MRNDHFFNYRVLINQHVNIIDKLNSMLNFCKHLSLQQQQNNQASFYPHKIKNKSKDSVHKLNKPNFPASNKIVLMKPDIKKGIKTHFKQIANKRKSGVTHLNLSHAPKLSESSTQTPKIMVHSERLQSKINSICQSKQVSKNVSPRHYQPPEKTFLKEKSFCLNQIRKQTILQQIQQNKYEITKQTKSTNFNIEPHFQANFFAKEQAEKVLKIDSYHDKQAYKPESFIFPQTLTPQKFFKKIQTESNQPQIQKKQEKSIIFSANQKGKFTKFMKNRQTIQSIGSDNINQEKKISSNKNSSKKKFLSTPQRKRILFERQTIISRVQMQDEEERSFVIEQSMIQEFEIKSKFIPIGTVNHSLTYNMYKAKQITTQLLVSIKQISLQYIDQISSQILFYKEVEQKKQSQKHILSLFQTQIDKNSYLFVKEPYTSTLVEFIISQKKHKRNPIQQIIKQLRQIFIYMQNQNVYLQRQIQLQDLVVCFSELKIHNSSLLTQNLEISQQKILQNFEQLLIRFHNFCQI